MPSKQFGEWLKSDLMRIEAKVDKLTEALATHTTNLALMKNDLNDHLHSHKLDAESRAASRNALYRNIIVVISVAQAVFELAKWMLGR